MNAERQSSELVMVSFDTGPVIEVGLTPFVIGKLLPLSFCIESIAARNIFR